MEPAAVLAAGVARLLREFTRQVLGALRLTASVPEQRYCLCAPTRCGLGCGAWVEGHADRLPARCLISESGSAVREQSARDDLGGRTEVRHRAVEPVEVGFVQQDCHEGASSCFALTTVQLAGAGCV